MKYLFPLLPLVLCSVSIHANASNDTNKNSNAQDIEIVSVTSVKQNLKISDTPDSVSVLLKQDIATISPQHINQIIAQAPGTWISRGNGQEHLTAIRSPVLTGAGSCGAFFMGVDGIAIRAPGFCNANQLFDVNYEQASSIDVLRSPSSTLYGSNALHGVINVISHDAFNSPLNSVSLQGGANDFARLSGSYSGQSKNTAWLTLANVTQENGYQDDSGYDQQKFSAIYQTVGSTWDTKTLLEVSNLNQETAGFIQGLKSYEDRQIRKTNPNPEAFRDVKSLRAYTQFSRETANGKLAFTPYLRANSMAFLQHFLPWKALEENSHNSLGMQSTYTFNSNKIAWLVGADIDYTQGALSETQAEDFSPNIPAGVHYDYDVNASQLAVYGQGIWQQQKWTIRFGARAERNSYDYQNLTDSNTACADNVAVCRFVRPDDQTRSFTAISPSVNAAYKLNENTLWYVKYSQGFRAPQATELFRLQDNQLVSDIDNENMNAWETGLRVTGKLNNRPGTLHVAAFNMSKSDVIFQNSDRQNVTGGKTKHQGLELEGRYSISSQWSFNGHVSYAKHTYENNTSLVSSDIKGNLIDTAPKWMSQANLKYQASNNWYAQLSWQYLSKYYLNPENTAAYDGHQLFDFHMHYQLSQQVNLSLHVLNLADKDYAERADFGFGNYRYFVGQPRRAFVNLQWLF